MTRRRFVQVKGELVEVSLDYQSEPRNADSVLWNDRAYQDMNDPRFSSRSEHREYMRRHGLSTADDYTEYWAKKARERAEFYRGADPERKTDLAKAFTVRRG